MSEASHAEAAHRRAGGTTPSSLGSRLAETLDATAALAAENDVRAEVTITLDDGWRWTVMATPPNWEAEEEIDPEDMTT